MSSFYRLRYSIQLTQEAPYFKYEQSLAAIIIKSDGTNIVKILENTFIFVLSGVFHPTTWSLGLYTRVSPIYRILSLSSNCESVRNPKKSYQLLKRAITGNKKWVTYNKLKQKRSFCFVFDRMAGNLVIWAAFLQPNSYFVSLLSAVQLLEVNNLAEVASLGP